MNSQMNMAEMIEAAPSLDVEVICNRIEDKILTPDELARLKDMNKKYTHVSVGGKQRVVILKPCVVNGETYSFESIGEFQGYFLHRDKIAGLNAGIAWLKWRGKRFKPDGIGFYPSNNCPNDVFNLYQGVKVKPDSSKSCELYLNHIERVICDGDKKAFQYIVGWLAHLIQRPEDKPSVAIVMKSVEGTGKGTMVKPLLEILGAHGVQINGAGQIGGRFNATMENKLLVFADEVDLTHPVTANKFKGLISESVINLERKGIDPEPMPNYSRFIFASNHENVIKAGLRERRYLVLEPNPDKAQNASYFAQLWGWINGGGASALLHYLQNYDLEGFTPNQAPVTSALIAEKLASLRPAEQFMFEQLSEVKPFLGVIRLPASDLNRYFGDWTAKNNMLLTAPQLRSFMGKLLSRMDIPVHGRSDTGIGKYYEVESADDWRKRFAKMLGDEVGDLF
jgi:putative DNA primase/helicase